MWIPEGMNAVRADGQAFPIEASVSSVEASGEELYILILRDLNERKARQEAEAECNTLRGINDYLQAEASANYSGEELIGVSKGLVQAMNLVVKSQY
jgi:hypothetical protein